MVIFNPLFNFSRHLCLDKVHAFVDFSGKTHGFRILKDFCLNSLSLITGVLLSTNPYNSYSFWYMKVVTVIMWCIDICNYYLWIWWLVSKFFMYNVFRFTCYFDWNQCHNPCSLIFLFCFCFSAWYILTLSS